MKVREAVGNALVIPRIENYNPEPFIASPRLIQLRQNSLNLDRCAKALAGLLLVLPDPEVAFAANDEHLVTLFHLRVRPSAPAVRARRTTTVKLLFVCELVENDTDTRAFETFSKFPNALLMVGMLGVLLPITEENLRHVRWVKHAKR